MSCAKIVRPVFIHHSSGASGMAREYLRRQIDFGLFHGQAHIYTQLNDLSEIDSWTLLIPTLYAECSYQSLALFPTAEEGKHIEMQTDSKFMGAESHEKTSV